MNGTGLWRGLLAVLAGGAILAAALVIVPMGSERGEQAGADGGVEALATAPAETPEVVGGPDAEAARADRVAEDAASSEGAAQAGDAAPEGDAAAAPITAAPDQPVASADATDPEVATDPGAAPVAEVRAPSIDVIQIAPDGTGLIAGSAGANRDVAVLLDREEAFRVAADASGSFVAFFEIPPADHPRVLSLVADPDGAARESDETLLVAPFGAGTEAPAAALAEAGDAPGEDVIAMLGAPDAATDPAARLAREGTGEGDGDRSGLAADAGEAAGSEADAVPGDAEVDPAAGLAQAGSSGGDAAGLGDSADAQSGDSAGVAGAATSDAEPAGETVAGTSVAEGAGPEARATAESVAGPEAVAEGDGSVPDADAGVDAADVAVAETTDAGTAGAFAGEDAGAARADGSGTAEDGPDLAEGATSGADEVADAGSAGAEAAGLDGDATGRPGSDGMESAGMADGAPAGGDSAGTDRDVEASTGPDGTEVGGGAEADSSGGQSMAAVGDAATGLGSDGAGGLSETASAEAGSAGTEGDSEAGAGADEIDVAMAEAGSGGADDRSDEATGADGGPEDGGASGARDGSARDAGSAMAEMSSGEDGESGGANSAQGAPGSAGADDAEVAVPAAESGADDSEEIAGADTAPVVLDTPVPPGAPAAGEAVTPGASGEGAARPSSTPPVLASDAEGVRVIQPAIDSTAPEAMDNVALDSITYDPGGEVELSGRATGDGSVRVYLDNRRLSDAAIAEDGGWKLNLPDVETGTYTLRIDELDAAGTVVSRVETPFLREEPEVVAAVMAEETRRAGFQVAVRTVQPGNTLWAIARDRYGEGILYVRVFEANRDLIRDPDLIYPGQIFRLPEGEGAATE